MQWRNRTLPPAWLRGNDKIVRIGGAPDLSLPVVSATFPPTGSARTYNDDGGGPLGQVAALA
jgi:hypothetical protein